MLSFNLEIEAMQIFVVALILPSLLLLSTTRVYCVIRIGGAVFAAAASLGWMVERVGDIEIPVDAVVNAFARHALWIAITAFILSAAFTMLPLSFERAAKPAVTTFAKEYLALRKFPGVFISVNLRRGAGVNQSWPLRKPRERVGTEPVSRRQNRVKHAAF